MERKYNGIAEVALKTRELDVYGEENVQLNYDVVNDRVWVDAVAAPSISISKKYEDENVIHCGFLCVPTTKMEIRMQIEREMREQGIEI